MTTRVVIAGITGRGAEHLRAVLANPDYTLVGVHDPDIATALAAAAGPGVPLIRSLTELCEDVETDAVVLALPPADRFGWAKGALLSGYHVLCEAPTSLLAAGGYDLGRLARGDGLRLQVAHLHRFAHPWATAARLVRDGTLGPIYRANLTATALFAGGLAASLRPDGEAWSEDGGGVLMTTGLAAVDALLGLVGRPTRVIALAAASRRRGDVEDDVSALVEWEAGGRGVVTVSTCDYGGEQRITLYGDRGVLDLDEHRVRIARAPDSVARLSRGGPAGVQHPELTWEDVPPAADTPTDPDGALRACHADFVAAIAARREPQVESATGTLAVEFANAAYLSVLTGQAIALPLDYDRYARLFLRLCRGELRPPERTMPGGAG